MNRARISLEGMRTWTPGQAQPAPMRDFRQLQEGRYQWALVPPGISFTLDRLRRERHELIGELNVQCNLEGVLEHAKVTPTGSLSTADFNLSSARARSDRARLLGERAKSDGQIDWAMYLEEFVERVFDAERSGQPDVELALVPKPEPDQVFSIDGITLLKLHPVLLFGDGGSFKSYLALYLAGRLALKGVKVLYADWELAVEPHRDRLERLFGLPLPMLRYIRCERPLVHEADRLRTIVRDRPIDYLICDSVAFACEGAPESAEVAAAYFRALRQIGVGSLQIAHVTKALEGADHKPFGSVYWHNGARATYYAQLAESAGEDVQIGIYPRKANLSKRALPTGFQIRFGPERTWITPIDLRNTPELASKLSLSQRLAHAVRRGPQLQSALADALETKEDTIRRVAEKQPDRFQRLRDVDGAWRIRLVETGREENP